jgi:hypothetical protein
MIQLISRAVWTPGSLTLDVPTSLDETVRVFSDKLRGGPAVIQLKKWYQSRTTGWKSQNHHINGHIAQLSQETAVDFDTLKLYLKNKAITRGYPYDILDDCVYPWSETRIDSLQASFLIDEIHQFAAERGIQLIEEEF